MDIDFVLKNAFDMSEINWELKHFRDLEAQELYDILQLRSRIFVVEQNCVYLDPDDKDTHCWHLCGWFNNDLAAYARIVPKGISYTEASIGRVVTAPEYRKAGIGKILMQRAILEAFNIFNTSTIKIGAQLYLKKFYEGFGFEQCSDPFIEDGIPHILMLRNP